MPNQRFSTERLLAQLRIVDGSPLPEQEWRFSLPIPAPFRGLPLYEGPNHNGLVNTITAGASRIARGAYLDGLGLTAVVVFEHLNRLGVKP